MLHCQFSCYYCKKMFHGAYDKTTQLLVYIEIYSIYTYCNIF